MQHWKSPIYVIYCCVWSATVSITELHWSDFFRLFPQPKTTLKIRQGHLAQRKPNDCKLEHVLPCYRACYNALAQVATLFSALVALHSTRTAIRLSIRQRRLAVFSRSYEVSSPLCTCLVLDYKLFSTYNGNGGSITLNRAIFLAVCSKNDCSATVGITYLHRANFFLTKKEH